MGVAVPQLAPASQDRVSGAQPIDGSLKFNASAYLTRTPSSAGNRNTWTWSGWVKRSDLTTSGNALFAAYDSSTARDVLRFDRSASGAELNLQSQQGSDTYGIYSNAALRDTGWYHVVAIYDDTNSTTADKQQLYVNGERLTSVSTENNGQDGGSTTINNTDIHYIGARSSDGNPSLQFDGAMSQVYFIDGQALGPEYFGFTDPLTNTWKPKKYTGTFQVAEGAPTVSNGGLVIKADGASINGSFAVSGGVKTWTSPDGVTWTRNGSGRSSAAAKYLAVGGAGIAFRTFYPDAGSGGFTFYMYNGGGEFDGSSSPFTLDLSSQTYLSSQTTSVGKNGFYLPMDGNSPIGHDKSKSNPINNGSIWSSGAGANFEAARPAFNGFDGSSSTFTRTDNASVTATVTLPSSIPFTTLQVRGARDSGNGTITINGVDVSSQFTSSSSTLETVTITGVTSPLQTIALTGISGSAQPRFAQIIVDGVVLVDDAYGNSWTPVNFGGSVAPDNPIVSGGKPFLNITQGGTQAGVGVFGSKENRVYTVTYADDGGGNKYYIDGVKQPTLNGLIRGSTYTFDTVALGSTHPFRLSATSAHGTEYTDGVDATTGTATTITIPHDAPDTLYYYCTAHSGMGSSITNITTDETKADPYASNCVLAVSFSGGRYQDDSHLLNCTTSYYASSGEGNIATGLSTISNFYHTSLFFDGTGDYFTSPTSNNSEMGMGTGDFTVEAWVYPTTLNSNNFIVNLTAGDSVFGYNSDGTLNIQLPSSGAPALTQKGPKIVANKWNHFAAVRESGVVRGYIDGVLAATVADTTDMGSTGKAVVGNHASLSREITGYLQDLRIYKGIAKYTRDFVVAETSPDILPDSPSGVSGSSKLTKITDGAVIFDGTGDKLSVPDSDDFHLGTNDFTIEYFVYKNNDMGGTRHHVGQYGTSNANRSFVIKSGQMPFHFLGFYWYNGSDEYNFIWNEGPMRTQEGWKHVCVQRKSGKLYLYIDGKMWKEETGASAALSINNSTAPLTIGSDSNTGSELAFNGSISNFRFINGTAIYRTGGFAPPTAPLTTTSQGATESEVKLLCCQSPTSATEAAVTPGSITASGDAAATNFNPFNTDINTVRGQETGYPTFNPLNNTTNTLSDGNTFVTGGSGWNTTLCTGEMISGKWFIELTHRGRQSASDNDIQFGLFGLNDTEDGYPLPGSKDIAAQTTGYCIVDAQAQWYNNSSSTGYGKTWDTPGDVVGMRFNADTGKLGFIINGQDQGDISTTLPNSGGGYPNQRWVAAVSLRGGNAKAEINFGQKPFKFPPPDGFLPLNNANLRPESVVIRPDQYVGISTWSGDSAASRNIDIGIKEPDLVWVKNRLVAGRSNYLYDSVRGFGANKEIVSDSNVEEGSSDHLTQNHGYVSGNTINGFTLAEGATNSNYTNQSGQSYVAWAWKAGGSKGTFNVDGVGYASAAAAGLTGGTITPSAASVGTKNGFSIIKFTGPGSAGFQSVPHGLGKKPNMIFCKDLDNARNWGVYQSDVIAGSDNIAFILNSTSQGFTSDTATWDVSEINETIFTPYFRDDFGASYGADNIAYVWCDIPGVQKFGTYDGNSSADGAMVECGFRPALVMCKAYNGSQPWQVYDNQRGKTNVIQNGLQWNSNNARYTGTDRIDFLSNGFKLKGSGGVEPNVDGLVYVYAAWAEAPSIDLYGGGANAR